MRTVVRILAVIVVGAVISCSDTQPMQPSEDPAILSAQEFSIPVDEPGVLHNEIVAAFYQEWPQDPARRSPEELCASLARAVNRVLPSYGVPPVVSPSDIAYFIHQNLVTWKRAGFDPDDPNANPVSITQQLLKQGVITPEEQQLLARYIEAETAGSSSQRTALALEDPMLASGNTRLFLDVASASEVFWSGDVRSRMLDGAGRSWGTKVIDGLGALAKLSPILRVIGAATASVLFEEYSGVIGDYFANYPPNPPRTLP